MAATDATKHLIRVDNDADINPRCYEELPQDLCIDIFKRLSVESVVRVACACKNWYRLIKDPSFTYKHLQFQKMMSKNRGSFLLQQSGQIGSVFNYFLFDDESINRVLNSSSSLSSYDNLLHFSLDKPDVGKFEINGPINGLYCLYKETNGIRESHIVIWNPTTNEVGFLPSPEQCLLTVSDCYQSKYSCGGVIGFGTDPLDEEDYKVNLICRYFIGIDLWEVSMLYTTRTNTWRFLEDDRAKLYLYHPLNNTYLNGAYYWLGRRKCTALVFDMSNQEAFREISIPCHGDLALHNDHITLSSVNKNSTEIDIWVMLEESNWMKKYSVRWIEGCVLRTLGFWKNELLLVIGHSSPHFYEYQIVLYNTTTQKITNLGPKGLQGGFKALCYYGSLVSLSGGITKFKGNTRASLFDTVLNFCSRRLD